MKAREHTQRTLRDILDVLFRYKIRIIIVFFAFLLVGALASLFSPPFYQASATILIGPGPGNVPATSSLIPQVSGPAVPDASQVERIRSEIDLLKSRALIEPVVAETGLKKLYPEHSPGFLRPIIEVIGTYLGRNESSATDNATNFFLKRLDVHSSNNSNVITVNFFHNDPDVAVQAVNRLVGQFIACHARTDQPPDDSGKETGAANGADKGVVARIRVVESAHITAKLTRSNTIRNILLAMALGILSGLCVALLSRRFAHTLSNPEDVGRYLGLPVLTSIGEPPGLRKR
jgi:uncharacterized protein involved in exopolysaccharide biosynthesis